MSVSPLHQLQEVRLGLPHLPHGVQQVSASLLRHETRDGADLFPLCLRHRWIGRPTALEQAEGEDAARLERCVHCLAEAEAVEGRLRFIAAIVAGVIHV